MTLLQSSCLRWSLFLTEFLGKRTITLTKTNIFNFCRLTTPKTKKSLTIKKPLWPFTTILSEKNPNPKSPMKHPKMPWAISLKISFLEKETNKSFFPLKINSAVLLKWPTSWQILMLKKKFHLLSSKNPCNSPITADQLHFSIWKELSFQKKI